MAEKIAFKQACPSCEALVPVKDAKLVGKKIDCPKCKFRFVVEKPAPSEEETEKPEQPAKKNAKTATKTKPVKKVVEQEEEFEDDDKPRKKKSGKAKSTKLMLGLGLGSVALVLLAVSGYYLLRDPGTKPPPRTTRPSFASTPSEDTGKQTTKKTDPKPTNPAGGPDFADASYHLPNDVEAVMNIRVKDFLQSPFGQSGFSGTAFKPEEIGKQLGFPLNTIERVLVASNVTQNWDFIIVRTRDAIKMDAVVTALGLKPADEAILGQDYFLTEAKWLDCLLSMDEQPREGGARPFAVRLQDPFTLVLAHHAPMKQFLEAKGKPAPRSGPKPPTPPPSTPGPKTPPASTSYATIEPRLKNMLDKLDANFIAVALDVEGAHGARLRDKLDRAPLNLKATANALGLGIQAKEGMTLTLGVDCTDQEVAKKLDKDLKERMPRVVEMISLLRQAPLIRFKWTPDNQAALIALDLQLKEKMVFCQTELGVDLTPQYAQFWRDAKATVETLSGPRSHDLAQALLNYQKDPNNAKKTYPLGAHERKIPPARLGRPWHPYERVSWMADLLPYLGHVELHKRIDFQMSWDEKDNRDVAHQLVPQFLTPEYPRSTWRVDYPGFTRENRPAATHYVGIAGIGPEAAENAPAGALGVFGYNRAFKPEEITDGLDQTIFLLQVPPSSKSPWMAGGGSTVCGVPSVKSIEPFLSTKVKGKRGTNALMGDGSVRFIAEDIADDVFKALCTVKNKDKEAPLKLEDIPLIPNPRTADPK